MKTVRFLAILCAFVALPFANPFRATAQIAPGVTQSAAQTATITGVVSLSDGTFVSGADVKLIGPALLSTTTDAHGAFQFTLVPHGIYTILASAGNYGTATRSNLAVSSDLNVTIQYAQASTQLRTIANVTTKIVGAHINVTAASIASVSPSDFAFKGNLSWGELLNQVPGTTIGGSEGYHTVADGNANAAVTGFAGSPLQPVALSINGGLDYETSASFDGMPLESATLASFSPGNGTDLSPFPLALFDTADIVRGPGADAPSIVDSVGGSFVLHAPGNVLKNSFTAAISNDPWGGFNGTTKLTYRFGKLSTTIVYAFNNSPGPYGDKPVLVPSYFAPATINGQAYSGGFQQWYSNPYTGNCYCQTQTTLFASVPQDTSWHQHDGGIALAYQFTPSLLAQVFYMGSRATEREPNPLALFTFTPGPGYTGSLQPGTYWTPYGGMTEPLPLLQAGSLFEEKVTAYIGHGVLRLAALQNGTYGYQEDNPQAPATYPLFGTADLCNDASCSTTTPAVFNGTPVAMTFSPGQFLCDISSRHQNLLLSFDNQFGPKTNIGVSYVKGQTAGNTTLTCCGEGFVENLATIGNFTTEEYRVFGNTDISDKLSLSASYYFTHADYHVPNPDNNNLWVDSLFHYSAPRLGATWRASKDLVIRGSAGGGFALPALFTLVGENGTLICNQYNIPPECEQRVTNINLQPEKSFGWDVGTDFRLHQDTSISFDLYRTDLYGQLFQSVNRTGIDPGTGFPIYTMGFLNLAHSRMEGLTLTMRHDIPRGTYWNAGVGFTRGYLVNVPPGFYNLGASPCNFTTGDNCVNTYAIPGQNFNGEYQSMVPYSNGAATVGYRWNPRAYIEIQGNYFGNDNSYLVPAFVEFNAAGSYPITKNVSLIATFRNLFATDDSAISCLCVNPQMLAPSIVGQQYELNQLPFGPRTLIVTARIDL